MTRITFTDPTLPNLPMLFDDEAMRGLIARQVAGAVEITSVRPTYVRYKPETSCLVAYDIGLIADGQEMTVQGHVRTFTDDRVLRRLDHPKLDRILEHAEEHAPVLPIDRLRYLPEVNGMFAIFPVDYDLRRLVRISSASAVKRYLRDILDQSDLELAGEPELIRYKPGRKALFRYETGDTTLYGKIHADNRTVLLRDATDALIARGLNTPPVVGTVPRFNLVVHAEAPGTQLASLRGDGRYSELLAALAEPLALLHRTPVPGLPVHHLGQEIDRLRETARLLGVILPALKERLGRIVCVLEDRLARIDDEMATNHGDFYDDQAMVDGDAISLIDFDEIRLAHPMLDIGNMLAHLRTGERRGTVPMDARPSFVAATREYREMSDRDLATFEAIGILKLAPGPFRRLEEGWPERIGEMIGMIEDILTSASPSTVIPSRNASAASVRVEGSLRQPDDHFRQDRDSSTLPQLRGRPGRDEDAQMDPNEDPLRDEKLPELPALQDPGTMQEALREATGDASLRLEGISIQRHKPGRRAIVRYDMAGAEPIWGKIFASRRGPRVHEMTRHICEASAFGPEVALPDPIAFLPGLRVLLQRSVPGAPIEPDAVAMMPELADRIAEAIHAFHASGIDLGREHDLDKELAPLHQRVEDIGRNAPDLGDEATELHARILDLAGNVQGWRHLPIHRDFYHDQVLVDGDRLSILDLDDAAMSEPGVDIANFATHLDLLALQRPEHAEAVISMRDRFLARSRELDPALEEGMLAFLRASTALRLAGIHVSRTDGDRIAAGMLDIAATSTRPIA